MRFRSSAPLAIIVAIVLVVAGAATISNRLFAGMTDAVEADQFRVMWAVPSLILILATSFMLVAYV